MDTTWNTSSVIEQGCHSNLVKMEKKKQLQTISFRPLILAKVCPYVVRIRGGTIRSAAVSIDSIRIRYGPCRYNTHVHDLRFKNQDF